MHRHFLVIGAQRSGTTYLYRLLEQHPDICMARPVRPEPKYFLSENGGTLDYEEYLRRCFGHRSGESLLGEKGTSYIEREDAIPRIRGVLPDVRLIVVLRDPVLRAYSNWKFSRESGLDPLGFDEALQAETARSREWDRSRYSASPFAYGARGHYVRYLDRWLEYYGRNRMSVVTSESLIQDPDVVRQLLIDLNVDHDVRLASPGRVNASSHTNELPPARAMHALIERYRADSERLAADWGVDISPWLV